MIIIIIMRVTNREHEIKIKRWRERVCESVCEEMSKKPKAETRGMKKL